MGVAGNCFMMFYKVNAVELNILRLILVIGPKTTVTAASGGIMSQMAECTKIRVAFDKFMMYDRRCWLPRKQLMRMSLITRTHSLPISQNLQRINEWKQVDSLQSLKLTQ